MNDEIGNYESDHDDDAMAVEMDVLHCDAIDQDTVPQQSPSHPTSEYSATEHS